MARRDEGQAGSHQKERGRGSLLERPTQPERQGLERLLKTKKWN